MARSGRETLRVGRNKARRSYGRGLLRIRPEPCKPAIRSFACDWGLRGLEFGFLMLRERYLECDPFARAAGL